MSPKDIPEALRMLADGKRFEYEGETILISNFGPVVEKVTRYFKIPFELWEHVTDWQLIEDPEPEFPFKTWERCLMRDGQLADWKPCEYGFVESGSFRAVGGNQWRLATSYDPEIIGTDKTPKAPVWTVKNGKPEVLK